MNSLFDKFAPAKSAFRPESVSEFFALRLASKLDDAQACSHYVTLASSYSAAQLLCAYRRTLRWNGNENRGRRFQAELQPVHANGSYEASVNLISIRVERRAVAAAIFHGDHLEFADARQLSSAHEKALSSAVGFIHWMLNRFPVESAALESIPTGYEFQRRVLHDAICQTLRERLLPIWEIPKAALLEGYGYPALKSRAQVREVATNIWPVLAGTHGKVFVQDAASLGLYVQTERQFIIK